MQSNEQLRRATTLFTHHDQKWYDQRINNINNYKFNYHYRRHHNKQPKIHSRAVRSWLIPLLRQFDTSTKPTSRSTLATRYPCIVYWQRRILSFPTSKHDLQSFQKKMHSQQNRGNLRSIQNLVYKAWKDFFSNETKKTERNNMTFKRCHSVHIEQNVTGKQNGTKDCTLEPRSSWARTFVISKKPHADSTVSIFFKLLKNLSDFTTQEDERSNKFTFFVTFQSTNTVEQQYLY